MSAKQDSVTRTIVVALVLCIVCSVIVSAAAVLLKPKQQANKENDRKSNILAAAGIKTEGKTIDEAFKQVETKYIDLQTGQFTDSVSEGYDDKKASKTADQSIQLSADNDIAKIKSIAKVKTVYLVKDGSEVKTLILPIHGKGLWSTLYGYLALEGDFNTVKGLTFYQHGETPGLGGEVDNPSWKASWKGKKVYKGDKALTKLIKGKVNDSTPNSEYVVDGLSGATLTSNGVTNLMQFWLGDNGYAPFIKNLKAGGA